MLKLKELFV